ncbi:MAG: aminopeptidase P family N-terminal domain-containing protein, partial [Muribaculaceae bacterium]|nr:aminopeptidase P family N-terminal domain-containing protein [Muribaculaceae bacterium]
MTRFIPHDFDSELQLRAGRIRTMMADRGIDALLVAGNTNIYYLSGRIFRGYLYLPLEGDLHFFVIRPNDFEAADCFTYIRKPEQITDWLNDNGYQLPALVGLEFNDLFYSDVERLRKLFPEARITDSSLMLRHARMIKT